MFFLIEATGSPLVARMNPIIYVALIFGIFIVAVAGSLAFLYNMLKAKQKSPEWIEAQKGRVTKKRDIEEFSKKYKVSSKYEEFLLKFCKKQKINNFLYTFRDLEYIEPFFRNHYVELLNSNNQKEINLLFRTKFEVERIVASLSTVNSTKAIPKNWKITEIFPDGSKAHYKVLENTSECITISIPEEVFNSDDKPEAMEKVAFTFKLETGMKYAFVSRLMRYEKKGENFCMIVSHSNDLIAKVARNFKRIPVNERCKIASCSVETNKKNEKKLVPAEKRFDVALTNISGGGCCVSTTLPVKENQNIYIELNFADGTYGIFGRIVKTRKAKTEGLYNLHVQFTDISLEAQNKILAKVYRYN